MSNVNRDWMSHRVQSDRISLTDEYKKGVEEFLDMAKKNGLIGDKTLCPCSRCKNSHWENLDTIKYHLCAFGFFESYTAWTLHGEKQPTMESRAPRHRKRRAPPIVEQPVDMYRLLRDGAGQDYYSFNDTADGSTNDDDQEPPNYDASQFYTEANEAGSPIYPGNKNYTKLSFCTRLLHFKDVSRCSEKSFNLLLDIIGDVLPKDHKLPSTCYKVKKMVKNLNLGYDKIDVCENNCMLFYGNDEKKVVCDICNESRYKRVLGKNGRKIPKKILRHFPLIPRLQRLYMSEYTAKHMTWHNDREIKEEELSHPADGDEWKYFDKRYPSFAKEVRNVRLGLSSDGFNPFGNSGNNVYTLWPVVVVVYNLPPWMCMKRPFMFMTLLVSGPDNPKKNLNVFLRPLMNELFILWQSGVETYDQSSKKNFIMKGALLWTISDFPALGMLSGWSTKGKMGCPVCVGNVEGFQLKKSGKCCFYGTYRTFLEENDPLRKKSQKYATTEVKVFNGRTKGEDLLTSLLQIEFAPPGNTSKKFKPRGYGENHHWTHVSMFWELPYWKFLDLRHCIDVMHTEKNVFENVFYTIVNDRVKSKDRKKSREDCKLLGVRSDLWIDENGVMPKAPYTITRAQLRLLCDWISNLKLPDGCVSNISRCIKWDTLRITGFKSHDCHIFMQKLMPIAFCELLPSYIVDALTALSNIFLDICSSILLRKDLDVLEKRVVRTMCVLETVFPPALFDIMEHLLVHLIEDCRLGGPVYYRWMYPFERLLKHMKDKVGNRARVEGSIAERYVEEEMINFSSFYFHSSIKTVHNTTRRNEVVVGAQNENVLEVFRYPLETIGKHATRYLNGSDLKIAEYYVLLNMPEVQPYIREFDAHIRANDPRISNERLEFLQKSEFKSWFKQKVEHDVNYELFKHLIDGPVCNIFSFQGCMVNGYRFHLNDGVFVKGTFYNDVLVNYYGQLEEIIKLIYGGGNFVYLFRCRWFDSVGDGVRIDKNRVVTIDVKSRLKSDEVFILASQAIQVYYTPSVLNPRSNLYTVVSCKNRPIDETTNAPNEDAFQENVSNASSSSFFIDFAQYDTIPIARTQDVEEEWQEFDEEDQEVEEDEENEREQESEDENGEETDGFEDID